jgi:acyl-CoA synthetase (AMP-forming)/AMP-acid ligase II
MPPAALSVYGCFADTARRYRELPFLAVLPETAAIYGIAAEEISYGEALARIDDLRDAYRCAGFGPGHRVGLLLENRPAFFLHWFALNAVGVSVVPINPDLRAAEIEYMVAHSDMVAAVAIASRQDDMLAAAQAAHRKLAIYGFDERPFTHGDPIPAAPIDRDTECALLYTSGTTGRPKGCVLTNDYFLGAGEWYARRGGMIALGQGCERMLTPLPLFHMNAMAYSAMAMLVTGGCLIAVDRFHPKTWWQSVRDSRATVLHYLGVMPAMLMSAPPTVEDRGHQIRFGFGAGVDRRLHAAFEERFGFPLIEAWAMTETGAGAVIIAHEEPRHIGENCFGRPAPDIEVALVKEDSTPAGLDEPGDLLVRRAGADPRRGFFREYLKDTKATAEVWAGDWFHTGDVVRRGADGSMYFIDRKKNVIRRSGENISAIEVESVLLQHSRVAQAAVAATPDSVRGDEVMAILVLRGDSAASERDVICADIVQWCLSRLAYYKAPGWIAFVDTLPLTGTQKIQRGALKDLVGEIVAEDRCFDMRAMKKRGG